MIRPIAKVALGDTLRVRAGGLAGACRWTVLL